MLSSLDAALESAFARAAVSTATKQRTPYDFGSSGSGIFDVDPNYGADQHQDQYEHYRGDFHSAAKIIVQRFASQPVFAAKLGVKNKSRSVSSMLEKGFIPPNGAPSWIGQPETMEVLAMHPLLSALQNPNPHMTQFNMWEIVIGSLLVTGRFFIVALPSETKGRALDLYPVPATWMKPKGTDKWTIKPPGETGDGLTVNDSQVANGRFADPSNLTGAISPLTMVARAVLSGEAIASSQYGEFKNGAMPKVALIAGDVMNETSFTDDPNRTSAARPVRLEPFQRRQIVTWFQQQYAGVAKHGLPIVLDQIIRDIKILSRKPNEMGYIDSAAFTKAQIFEQLGVSTILTGQMAGATRANGDLADKIFVTNGLNPITMLVSQVLTLKFGPLFSLPGERLAIWVAPALYQDSEYDIELLRLLVRSYGILPNELRSIARRRFGGLPWLERFENVIMPQTLDSRGEDDDWMGIGRISVLKPTEPAATEPKPEAEPEADDDENEDDEEKKSVVNGNNRFTMNGHL